MVVVLPRGRRGSLPDRQLLGRDRGVRRDRQRQRHRPDQAGSFSGPCIGTAADVVDDDGPAGPRRGRRAGHPRTAARNDPRLLARRGAATRRRTGRGSPASGSTATGRSSTRTASGTSRAARDDTLKVAGKRVGPAEVESAAVSPTPRSLEAAAIGVPHDDQGRGRRRARASCARRGRRRRRSARRSAATVVARARQAAQARGRGGRAGAAQDPLGQGHAPGDPGGLAGPRPGRPVRRSTTRATLDDDPRASRPIRRSGG